MSEDIHGVEPEGMNAGAIAGTVAVSIVLVVVLIIAGFSMAMNRFKQADLDATQISGYPLNVETRLAGQAQLTGYERLPNESNIYRIPIERAMELVVDESGQ